jgi:hypothetical protein
MTRLPARSNKLTGRKHFEAQLISRYPQDGRLDAAAVGGGGGEEQKQ